MVKPLFNTYRTVMNTQELYAEYVSLMQKAADLNNAAALLSWDQETYMPSKGAGFRARQLATLAGQAHEILTSPRLSDVMEALHERKDLQPDEKANVTRSYEDYLKHKKLPGAFVESLSMLTSECFTAWMEARKENNYGLFAPSLTRMIAMKREQTKLLGYEAHPYDALLDEYEPGATTALLDNVFDGIRTDLPPILERIRNAQQVDDAIFLKHYPKEQQWEFSVAILKAMGYDMEAGRQDYSEHPFTVSFSPDDVRVTTRVDEDNYASLLWSTIHEGGHALYEQGLLPYNYGLPLGTAASLGIHESQSRLWENCIGRSSTFWQHFFPRLKNTFPQQLAHAGWQDIWKACNKVIPSLIRTEADELTYHFHVLIRYELEKQLIEGKLDASDLKEAWNNAYEHYLGIRPADDRTGILQDVHWSHGSFGYFPTYTLGSFYAAQFYAGAQKAMPELEHEIAAGNFTNLLQWLRTHIHIHGRRYYSDELCEVVTGEKLNVNYFLNYVKQKYAQVYGITF